MKGMPASNAAFSVSAIFGLGLKPNSACTRDHQEHLISGTFCLRDGTTVCKMGSVHSRGR